MQDAGGSSLLKNCTYQGRIIMGVSRPTKTQPYPPASFSRTKKLSLTNNAPEMGQ